MAVHTQITCDHCGRTVPKSMHTRIKWSKTAERDPGDYCPDCRDIIMEALNILPPLLNGMKPSELAGPGPEPGDPSPAVIRRRAAAIRAEKAGRQPAATAR